MVKPAEDVIMETLFYHGVDDNLSVTLEIIRHLTLEGYEIKRIRLPAHHAPAN